MTTGTARRWIGWLAALVAGVLLWLALIYAWDLLIGLPSW